MHLTAVCMFFFFLLVPSVQWRPCRNFVQHFFVNQMNTKTMNSARFWLKKLLAQVHATQKIYLHNIVGTCTKEGLNKENNTQIAKYKKHSDLIPWKFVKMSNFFEFLFILKFVTKKLHAQCACRLENLLAQRKKCMHLCKCACVKSSTDNEQWTVKLNLKSELLVKETNSNY